MGWGDLLMSAGEARVLHKSTAQPVLIVDRHGRPVWHETLEGTPYLLKDTPHNTPHQRLINGPGIRPYIVSKTRQQWVWRKYTPKPAKLFCVPDAVPVNRVLIEPNVKNIGHANKDWGWNNWQALVDSFPAGTFLQCDYGARKLSGVDIVSTHRLLDACAALASCRAYVGPEGGMHHAAAALGKPAVVVFGGFISPKVTGYNTHRNLFTGISLGCGSRIDCASCRLAMQRITVDEVAKNLQEILSAKTC